MRQLVIVSVTIAALLTTVSASVRAQIPAPAAPALAPATHAQPPDAALEEWSTTQHSMRLGGRTIPYVAKAGTTAIRNDEGEITGLMYSVSYTHGEAPGSSARPVTFLFNGGPGSASMWLHMGSFGPMKVDASTPEMERPAPFRLAANPDTLLDKTDLVFIDAVTTGA